MPRHLAAICISGAGWSFGFGLGAALASPWLRDAPSAGTLAGLDPAASAHDLNTIIGANTGIYYLGIALAAGLVPWMMRRWGRGGLVAGMVISGLTVAWLPWSGSLGFWFLLRFVNGIAGAMSLIPLETLVNRLATPEERARHFGYYAFAIALGWALGSWVGLEMYKALPRLAFVVGGLVSVLAGLFLLRALTWPAEPVEEPNRSPAIPIKHNLLGFGSAWSQGFLEGMMVAFLVVYLASLGLADQEVDLLPSGIMMGVILLQIPIAFLADRLGRTAVLLGCYAVTLLGLGFLPFCGPESVGLRVWLFLVGACSGAFYPLGLAILGERLPKTHMARAGAWYLGINCCGSLIGPIVSGMAMDRFGQPAMFIVAAAAVASVLVAWLATGGPWSRGETTSIPPVAATDVEIREAA
jgi:MFS family permease